MTPLEESDSKSTDYIAAINYRLSLFNTLIGHEKRSKAGTNRSYSLPLRHHNFKSLHNSWDTQQAHFEMQMVNPLALLSKGTGQDYVQVDPYLTSIDVHTSIIEKVQCLDKSVQKKRESIEDHSVRPTQVLLNSFHHSIKNDISRARSLEDHMSNHVFAEDNYCKWEEYFGDSTPFGGQLSFRPKRVHVDNISVETFDSMDDERIVLEEKRIVLCRILRNQDGKYCTEFIVWGDNGCKERSPLKRFILKSIVRIPTFSFMNTVSFNGDKVYTRLDGNPYGELDVGLGRRLYQFSLSPNIEDGQQYYVQQKCSFLSNNKITSIHPYGRHHVLVGTDMGTTEIWDCGSAPNLTKTLYATNAFPEDVEENGFANLLLGQGRSQNFFIISQVNGEEGVLTLWQSPFVGGLTGAADFQMMVKIEYERIINFVWNGFYLMILAYDKFGCLLWMFITFSDQNM